MGLFGQTSMPTAVKNLLIINIIAFLAVYLLPQYDIDQWFGLHYYMADSFGFWQFITYMFLHSGFSHIFFNMFALYMFGAWLEQLWGTKRFLIYYFITGIGAGLVQEVALYFDLKPFIESVTAFLNSGTNSEIQSLLEQYVAPFSVDSSVLISKFIDSYNAVVHTDPAQGMALARQFFMEYQTMYLDAKVTVGASGAVFGLLLAFGMMFPNARLMLLIPPIPIKAKYFVIGYGAIELIGGIADFNFDNVAHWAHLGGMLFGFFLIRHWKKNLNQFNY